MKAKVKSKKAKVGIHPLPSMTIAASSLSVGWRRLIRLLPFAFLLFTFYLARVSAHEPITTKVRFNKEVVRILGRSCLSCHHPGGVAMSLATYDDARPWAKAIKEEVLNKRMPPWAAVKGFGDFRNAPVLTQREVDLLVNWVEGGAPRGEEGDLPTTPLYSDDWQLGKPDLILKPPTPASIAADADERRTVTLATNLTEARGLAAIDLRPGDQRVVHCARVYLEGGSCLATWMPGQKTVAWNEGVAQALPAGARLTVKIHYRGAGEATRDQSEVGLYFAKTPPRRLLQEIAVNDAEAIIPAGAAMHPLRVSYTTTEDLDALALRPIVNPLITSLQMTAYRPDGSEEVLLWTRGYQSDWQPTYYLKRPALLPKGTRLEVIAYFDNSDNNPNNPNDPAKALRFADLGGEPLCAVTTAKARPTNE
ncbi:MAG TPA: cytochrome c [Blastocatellia bacterium]|nr:cytochrome c [Blastocatellia bacterium]